MFEKETEATLQAATTKKGIAPELLADIAAAALGERPIILLGDVGVGKSILIRRLIKIDAAAALKKAIVLYVDFGSEPAIADDLKRYVQAEFVRQLRANFGVDVTQTRSFVTSTREIWGGSRAA